MGVTGFGLPEVFHLSRTVPAYLLEGYAVSYYPSPLPAGGPSLGDPRITKEPQGSY